jgi:D-alanine-D-alanine ligase
MNSMKKNIALITGGFTGEYVISLKSAATVERNLNKEKYNVYTINISREGRFYEDKQGERHSVDMNDFSLNLEGEKILFDAAFIILHGSPGEDGKLQGYFDLLNIPYTTCNALTSALTMNKAWTKAVLQGVEELHLAKSVLVNAADENSMEQVKTELQLPYFVKTLTGGSSIGMSKVKNTEDLKEALEKALKEDDKVLVEEFVEGREFSVGVYRTKSGLKVLPATEVIPPGDFFDYEAKYTPGLTEEITPGRMSEEEVARVNRIAAKVYEKLDCGGVVRIDYFLQKETGKFYFIEINTVPGQTETSFIPQQVRAAGMDIRDFYSELLEMIL